MKKIIFLLLILIIFSFGCSNQQEVSPEPEPEQEKSSKPPEPISADEAESLPIQDYFPTVPETVREYKTLDETGKVLVKDYEVINSFGSTALLSPEELGQFVILRSSEIYEPDLSVRESRDSYELKNNTLIRLATENGNSSNSTEENEILLTNQPSWQLTSNITRTITATGTTIRTEAGEFSDCIETTDTADDNEQYRMKSYFAPGKGLILVKKQAEDTTNYVTVKEMINFIPPESGTATEAPDADTKTENPSSSQETPEGSFVYHNENYGFFLDLPAIWKDHYMIEETETDGEETINFRFKSGDNLYIDTIVYIIITDKTKEQIEQENAESGFPMTYAASNDGKSYAYLYNVGDPSNELINNEDDLLLLMELKQQVPEVMETLRFQP